MAMTSKLAFPKGPTRKTLNARKKRTDRAVLAQVRREVFARDLTCRLALVDDMPECFGRLELAHLTRRSATRGMAPARRHRVSEAIVLCALHHAMEERHQLTWRYLTPHKADGHIEWTVTR